MSNYTMEPQALMPQPTTSCASRLSGLLLSGNLERTIVSTCLGKQRFMPFESERYATVQTLFAQQGISIEDERLTELEQDEHLTTVAQKAKLNSPESKANWLCLYKQSPNDRRNVHLDALTAASVTHFIDGYICHAIALPSTTYELAKQEKHEAQTTPTQNKHTHILLGMIEREIARISMAYSRNDDGLVQQFKINTQSAGGVLGATAVALLLNPLIVLPFFPCLALLHFVRNESCQISSETKADKKAIELAGTAKHILATVQHSSPSPFTAEINIRSASTALTNNEVPESLNLYALRFYTVLKAQDRLKKLHEAGHASDKIKKEKDE